MSQFFFLQAKPSTVETLERLEKVNLPQENTDLSDIMQKIV